MGVGGVERGQTDMAPLRRDERYLCDDRHIMYPGRGRALQPRLYRALVEGLEEKLFSFIFSILDFSVGNVLELYPLALIK